MSEEIIKIIDNRISELEERMNKIDEKDKVHPMKKMLDYPNRYDELKLLKKKIEEED